MEYNSILLRGVVLHVTRRAVERSFATLYPDAVATGFGPSTGIEDTMGGYDWG